MAVVESLNFKDWGGRSRSVRFIAEEQSPTTRGFQSTVITGRNGSHKSTLLRELVAALTVPGSASSIRLRSKGDASVHVICTSGSVADRFPSKETPGGGNSVFDVPNYAYLGQRVGVNLLSKKRPLETMLTFALDEAKAHRFAWPFFEHAHKFAGIKPHVEYELLPKRRSNKNPMFDILGTVQAAANPADSPRSKTSPQVSKATADWLLSEFDYDDFTALEQLLSKKGKRISLVLNGKGASCDTAPATALRLGLLTDSLSLSEAKVRSRFDASKYSAFDLSSGEYHMYTSILGLGFGVVDSSVVLIDEPENSLHPQWQQEFMDSVYGIGSQTLGQGHLVVCTHSPLIVSAALEGSTIVDLTDEMPEVASSPYGASSDEVLLSQFGVASSRNRVVIDTVQRAVSLVERGAFNDPDFQKMKMELANIRQALRPDDPLVDVINALLDEEDIR
jgi:hypothetical protein